MPTVDELVTVLGIEIDPATKSGMANFQQGLDRIRTIARNATIALAGFGVATGMMVKNAAEEANELQKLSDKTGISTEALQEWGYAAAKSGLDAKSIQNDLVSLQKTMSSPIPGQFNMTMAMFGVSARGANGQLKTTDQLLLDMSNKFQGMSQQRAAQWASKLGFSDDTLLLLRKGKEGIEALRKEGRDLGAIISAEAIKRAAEFHKRLSDSQFVMHTLSMQLSISLIPAMTRILDVFDGLVTESKGWVATRLAEFSGGLATAIERIVKAFEAVKEKVKPATDAFTNFFTLDGKMSGEEFWGHMLTGALAAIAALLAPLAVKAMLVSAGVLALSAAFEDLYVYLFGEKDNSDNTIIARLIGPVDDLKKKFNEVFGDFEKKYPSLAKGWENIKNALKGLNTEFGVLKVLVESVFETIQKILSGIDTAIEFYSKEGGLVSSSIDLLSGRAGEREDREAKLIRDRARKDAALLLKAPIPKASAPLGAGGVTNDNKTINITVAGSMDSMMTAMAIGQFLGGVGMTMQPIAQPGAFAPVVSP